MTSLQEVYVSVKGIIADNLESMGVEASSSDGLTTLAGKILDIEPSVSGLDLDTALTLSASSSTVTVNDSITLTATLTASYDDETLVNVDLQGVLQNATIKFYEGSTLKGTATTNSSGVATYTYTPTTGGNKTVKAVFDGTDNFQDAESSDVSITVNKIQSYISLLGSASITVGSTLTLNGVLMDDDNETINNASVKLYKDNVLFNTLTTDSQGAYSTTISNLAVGSYAFKTTYEGSDVYQSVTSSTLNVTVSNIVPDSISLTSDKSILSYADSESATLSATVLDSNDDPIENVTVTFYNGSTSMGTATTNASGVATKSYSSSGAGDVSFSAEVGSLVSESFEVEDCKWYHTLTDSSADSHLIRTGITCSYTSNGLNVTNGNWKELVFDTPITQGTSIEYDITQVGGSYTPKSYDGFFSAYGQGNTGLCNFEPNATGHVKITYANNTVQYSLDNTLLTDTVSSSTSPTITTTPVYYKISTGSSRQYTIKNMKIKSL